MKRKQPNPNECYHCGKPVGADQPGSIRWDFTDVVYCNRACWDALREEAERTQLWMTAVHEAGHCLGARLGNRRITKATIEPSKKFNGCVHSEHDPNKKWSETSGFRIEEWLLGHAAEVEFGFSGGGHGYDYDQVAEMLKAPIRSAKSKAWAEKHNVWGRYVIDGVEHRHEPYHRWDVPSYLRKDWQKSVRVTKPEWKPEFDKRVRKARRLAKKYRAWIERVAKLLMEKRTLTDEGIPPL